MANRRRKNRSRSYRKTTDINAEVSFDWHGLGVRLAVVTVGIGFAALMWSMNVPEYGVLKEKQQALRAAEAAEAVALGELERHQTERQSLLNDTTVLEAYGRDRLGWVRPNEEIVRIERE